MGEVMGRRAQKTAQTRELIRSVAQRLFDKHGFDAVTVAEIARESDVAVQTVFNHFATKEDLFFDGRTPWVDEMPDSVRRRDPGITPLEALRTYLVELIAERVGSLSCPKRRRYIATIEASETLPARERELIHAAEVNVQNALLEAWSEEGRDRPVDPEASAPVIAAVWLAAGRSLVHAQRPKLSRGADPEQTAAVAAMAERVLQQLERGAVAAHCQPQDNVPASTADPEIGCPKSGHRAG